MRIAVPVTEDRQVTTLSDYEKVDIFTFKGEKAVKLESIVNLTGFKLPMAVGRSIVGKKVDAVIATDMSEKMIGYFLKRDVQVKLGYSGNAKTASEAYVKERMEQA